MLQALRNAGWHNYSLFVRDDGLFVNAAMVREGLARVAARGPLTRLDELKRAESEAQRLYFASLGDLNDFITLRLNSRPADKPEDGVS